MGQNSSRNRQSGVEPQIATNHDNTTNSTQTQTSVVSDAANTPIAAGKPSKRTSIRKSILKLVKPSSSSPTPPANTSMIPTSTASAQTIRKRPWRSSRRVSAPPHTDTVPLEPHAEEISAPVRVPTPIAEKGKEKEHELEHQNTDDGVDSCSLDDGQRPNESGSASSSTGFGSFPSMSGSSTIHTDNEVNIPTISMTSANLKKEDEFDAPSPILRRLDDEDEVVISPQSNIPDRTSIAPASVVDASTTHAEELDTPPVTTSSPPITVTTDQTEPPQHQSPPPPLSHAQTTPTPIRQFPPPGTLVVVQGVVHTTDVPVSRQSNETSSNLSNTPPVSRRRASSTPRPSTSDGRSSTLNRLSALIPRARPTSMLAPPSGTGSLRPSSGLSLGLGLGLSASENGSSSTEVNPTPSEGESRIGSESMHDDEGGNGRSSRGENENGAREGERQEGPISNSSIDVLGTLLSVAAAATAASLLTGSSEPIFSSGLAPPGSSLPTTQSFPDPSNPSTVNMNPATRPLSPTPTAGLGALGFDRETGRERMRTAWGSLRERLGLRSTTGEGAPGGGTRTPADAREAMLAEMARAFNLGLGLTNINGEPVAAAPSNQNSGEDAPEGAGAERTLPPEDSFERFLIDLQADLRVALSTTPLGDQDSPASEDGGAESMSARPSSPISSTAAPAPDQHTDEEPPALQDVTDSEDEFSEDDGGVDGYEDDDNTFTARNDTVPSSPLNVAAPQSSSNELHDTQVSAPPDTQSQTHPETSASAPPPATGSSASGTQRRPGGGINWWRLYRFLPIPAPQAQGLSATFNPTLASNPPTHPNQVPVPTPTPVAPQPSTSTSEPTTSDSEAPPAENVVIPVIVVGLQSVNIRQREHGGEDPFGAEEPGPQAGDEMNFDQFPTPPENEGGLRGRRWRSRAADALRSLRPGRRGAGGGGRSEAAGSRTFLIYVIGGYYPPDHHIVTGASTLDSFEALWELAELLGQAKPPTASKDDIEKSGLEIIRPSALEQYEKDGKVSSNCLDRCLICLDDYEPEDEVRLLACRHAFHKNCVDKWMLTGRNNCPACRSKGVSTEGTSSATHASEA